MYAIIDTAKRKNNMILDVSCKCIISVSSGLSFFSHAGYVYCGACGGHAYRQIDPTNMWVFVYSTLRNCQFSLLTQNGV